MMLAKERSVLLHLLLLSINIYLCFALTCKDESGRSVDWFVVYKIPKLEQRRDELKDGLSYAFITSNRDTGRWTLSKRRISDANSLFGSTILPLYSKSGEKYTKILYSDQQPDGKTSSSHAHSKGVIAMDADTGFWLTHSVPKYPTPFTEPYKYPDSGDDNGQTALCISFSTEQEAQNIINHLLVLRPKIYSSFFDTKTIELVPNLENLKKSKWLKDSFKQSSIKSLRNDEFITFSKNGRILNDLYEKNIAPFINGNLLVESWRKGQGTILPSSCQRLKILNIEKVNLKLANGETSGEWSYTKDHSKWLISEDSKKSFVCIGDLNRMMSQNKRGGGAVCFRNSSVWKSFRESIVKLETCT